MILGVTGIFGSGKTTVSAIFKEHGFYIINVDRLYREMIKPNTLLYQRITNEFGTSILKPSGQINRKKLKILVFNNSGNLKRLNEITHPYIINRIKEKISRSKKPNIVVDAPLLIEANAAWLVDKVIVVKAGKAKIMQRLIKKGKYTKEEIKSITNSQMSLREKLKYADYVVDNRGSIAETKKQIRKITKM